MTWIKGLGGWSGDIRKGFLCLCMTLLLTGVTDRSWAQTDRDFLPIDPALDGVRVEVHQPDTPYQAHAKALQEDLIRIHRLLNHLSVVDPVCYTGLQKELHHYLDSLKLRRVDYGRGDTFQRIRLYWQTLEQRATRSLVDNRRQVLAGELTPVSVGTDAVRHQVVCLRPYAPLFRRPDYRARSQHLVGEGAFAVVLRKIGDYYFVQNGPLKGYVHQKMILPQ